ncbi:MAG TPA: hypothetical protein VNJ54_15140 [Plantibacter sp.]|uniref:hypothetical protein n=1 Tax=Plantibacter sp. TaxID=1871045 RepID=UPI002BB6FD9B|nr:hypothetical protein [Plantibacter sp.]
MSTVDVLVCLVAFLMVLLAVEMNRAERALERADELAEENHWLRMDLQATSLSDQEWERLCERASNVVEFPARWTNGNGETA